MLKQIMIPVAAFAVTVTGASAFGGDGYMLNKLDMLSDTEQAAFAEAREVRETSRIKARAVLTEAGIDDERRAAIHEAMRETRTEHREAVQSALETGDYDVFIKAVAGTPLANVITSEADFEKFVEAHELRQSGDFEAAREIMEELGFERPEGGRGSGMKGGRGEMQGERAGGNGLGGPSHGGGMRGGWESVEIE